MDQFTPISSLLGGMCIGLAAVFLQVTIGRVAGVSGVLGRSLDGRAFPWRIAFLAGLPTGAVLFALLFGKPEIVAPTPLPWMILAGLLVGFGTRLANGCTSGHAICGLAQGRSRSITATAVFMTVGVLTAITAARFFQ